MYNKGLILTNAFAVNSNVDYQVSRISEEFEKLGIKIDHLKNNTLLLFVEQDGNIKKVNSSLDYDFVIYLDKDLYISRMLEKSGFKLFNSSSSIELCDDKMLTHICLANNGIRMPRTVSYPLCYDYNNNYSLFMNNVIYNFSFPFLIKENYGSLGKQIYLINSKKDLLRKEMELRYKPHIYQEFIKESSGTDYRLILIGNKVVASMKRVNETGYAANIALGGKGFPFTPTKEICEMAIKASKLLNLNYCGIDFVKDRNDNYYLIEVNSNAFFSEIEKISKVNIAEAYAKHIYQEIYK